MLCKSETILCTAFAAVLLSALTMLGCGDSRVNEAGPAKKSIEKVADNAEVPPKFFTVDGWVLNPHTELGHTVIGFRTTDDRLLNLVFAGMHQQLTDGMYCRIAYHQLVDDKHLPDMLRQYTRQADINYLVLDSVELLPAPRDSGSGIRPKQKKED
ncbi:MAG: hypothetical protein Q8Q39_01320 [bacterium]|nr:hypothetical protein [bacterium]